MQCYNMNQKRVFKIASILSFLLFLSIVMEACSKNDDGIVRMPVIPEKDNENHAKRGEGVFKFTQFKPFASRPVDIHYYLPMKGDISKMPIIFIFQGNDRNYTYLLDAWSIQAECKGFIVVIPQFDSNKFPTYLYQETGIMSDANHSQLTPRDETTACLIDHIFETFKRKIGSVRNDFQMYGHSAGGQFVQRYMMFHDSPYVSLAVVGSPGWYTFPDSTIKFPYGTADINYINDESIQKYFAKDIVIQTASGDTLRESFLRTTKQADKQGRNRLERGLHFYEFCKQMAIRKGWEFRWRQTTVANVGHESVKMGMAAVNLLLDSYKPNNTTHTRSGKNDIPNSSQIYQSFEHLAKGNPHWIKMKTIGITPGGKPINEYILSSPNAMNAAKVWIQSGLHGNEPAPVQSSCRLAEYLLSTDEGKQLLYKVRLALVPIANPDGYDKMERKSGTGLDLNRDMTKMADPVTRILKQAYFEFRPDVTLDIHEFRPRRKETDSYFGKKLEIDYDVLLMDGAHPNADEDMKLFQQRLYQTRLENALAERGYSFDKYFTPHLENNQLVAYKDAKNPQSSSTWNSLAGAFSFFAEIKGIGYGTKLIDKRADIGLTIAKSILHTTAEHKNSVKQTTAQAKNHNYLTSEPVVPSFSTAMTQRAYNYRDLETGHCVSYMLPVRDALQPIPEITRNRPEAYLLMPSCRKAIEILNAWGVHIQRLSKDSLLKVEQYELKSIQRGTRWENIHPTKVVTETQPTVVTFPCGSFLVSTRQSLGNLIVTMLEPESACGFINFGVVKIDSNHTIPVYRLMHE